jgi:hypothetical protein
MPPIKNYKPAVPLLIDSNNNKANNDDEETFFDNQLTRIPGHHLLTLIESLDNVC